MLKHFLKTVGELTIKAAGGGFSMLHNFLQGYVVDWTYIILIELLLSGCKDSTEPLPDME